MELWWSDPFDRYLDDMETRADAGDEQVLVRIYAALDTLRGLKEPPRADTQTLKRVRQSRKYPVWRVSHPYVQGLAIQLICWFPPDDHRVVVALFSGDKANRGDVFYDSVGVRADRIIDIWCQEEG